MFDGDVRAIAGITCTQLPLSSGPSHLSNPAVDLAAPRRIAIELNFRQMFLNITGMYHYMSDLGSIDSVKPMPGMKEPIKIPGNPACFAGAPATCMSFTRDYISLSHRDRDADGGLIAWLHAGSVVDAGLFYICADKFDPAQPAGLAFEPGHNDLLWLNPEVGWAPLEDRH